MTHADETQSANSAQPVRLSACIIVKDEERRLPDCLASVAFCDEVIVVDSGSTDRTVEIARAAGARVLERPWKGFAVQRNIALDEAHGEWALEVDADERVTPRLRNEILALIANPPPQVDNAVIPLRQLFLGVPLGPSAMYPAGRMRLLRRDRYRHDSRRTVHEGLWPIGQSAYLTGELEHILAESVREAVRDLRSYTSLELKQLPETTPVRALLLGAVLRPAGKFVYRMWLMGGWRDGPVGMTKILFDCLYDALTWIRFVRTRSRQATIVQRGDVHGSPRDGASEAGHFGQTSEYSGPIRVAAVARGIRRTAAAHDWLERAAGDGADVVLITDVHPATTRVRTIEIERAGPLAVLRAIAGEWQRNPIEVVAIPSRRGRAVGRLLPAHLRGVIPTVSLRATPRESMKAALDLRPEVH